VIVSIAFSYKYIDLALNLRIYRKVFNISKDLYNSSLQRYLFH
jgi:hypothetical protein